MASIRNEIALGASPERVWDALRDFGAVHQRVAPGFLTDSTMDGDGVRVVTFANGAIVRETLVSTDDENRRLVYAIIDQRFEHYSTSVQVFTDGAGSRVIWIIDLLPDALAGYVTQMAQQGAVAMKTALEKA
ncbi:MAG: SRPBCC family protein [Alphaproteobacteria bacterium]|nr:MAG: SRPBCC family protein [Alphaproteobacteria bacterium]